MDENQETQAGPDIVLLDHAGQPQTYSFPEVLQVDTAEGETTEYIHESVASRLPKVTQEDDGKVLGVEEGQWQAIPAPETYTHPSTHDAGMITGLAPVATGGSYDSLLGAPCGKRTVLPLGGYRLPWDEVDKIYCDAVRIEEVPAVGTVCTVVWEEETFHTAVRASETALFSGWSAIGNAALFEQGANDTGEPFFMVFGTAQTGEAVAFISTNTGDTIRCHVCIADGVRKLDQKYLPDGIATEQFVLDAVAAGGNGGGSGGTTITEEEILAEQTFTTAFLEQAGCFLMDVIVPAGFGLTIGQEYLVRVDGTEYTCTCLDADAVIPGAVGLGNGTPLGLSGNGEPFAVSYVPGQDQITVFCFTDMAPTEHTIRIYQNVETAVSTASTLPEFDLTAMGLPEVPPDGTMVQCTCDTAELMAALDRGPVRIRFSALGDTPAGVITALNVGGTYQYGFVFLLEGTLCALTFVITPGGMMAVCKALTTL